MHNKRFAALIAVTFICLPSVSTIVGCSENKVDSRICDVYERSMSTTADEKTKYGNAWNDAATVLSTVTNERLQVEIARMGPEIRLHTTSTGGLLENPRKECVFFCARALTSECIRRQDLELMNTSIREIPISEFGVSFVDVAAMQWGPQSCGLDIMYKASVDPAVDQLVAMQLGDMLSAVFDCQLDATAISHAYSAWDSKRGVMCIDPEYLDQMKDYRRGALQERPRGMFRVCQ